MINGGSLLRAFSCVRERTYGRVAGCAVGC